MYYKTAWRGGGARPFRVTGLEVELQPELHNTWVEGRGELAEVTRAEVGTGLVELGVIPDVERFGAEFQAAASRFAEDEALEQGDVPVVAAGATRSVVTEVAEGPNHGVRERRRIEVLDILFLGCANGLRIGDFAHEVWTVSCVRQTVAALGAAEADVKRKAGFQRDDAGNFPATDGSPNQPIVVVTEERDVVDEVDHGIVRSVKATGADVILPPQVRVRDVLQILATASTVAAGGVAGARINGLRVRIESPQKEVFADLRVQVQLQAVVMGVGFIG